MVQQFSEQKMQQLLKSELGWDKPLRCQEGFWINSYTLIKADEVRVVNVERQTLDGETNKGHVPLVIFEGVVELIIDKENKIVSVDTRDKLGLWIDSLRKIINEQKH